MLMGGRLGLRALPFADVTCATSGTSGTVLSLNWLGCRTWYCLIVGWMRRSRANSRNPLSQSSHRQLSKREAPFLLFDCIQILEVLLFALFSVEEVGAGSRQRESTGNDIVRELMGIA